MDLISPLLSWVHNIGITELFNKNRQTVEMCINAIVVFVVVWLFIKGAVTAIMLPYTLKKSQKAMENVIANAQKQFPDEDFSEQLISNTKKE